MGYGDELMATGMAKGAAARGKRIAFGGGKQILLGVCCEEIFRGNPNIAPMGSEADPNLEWIPHYKGHRLYNHREGDRWIWNMSFRPEPGELFFTNEEKRRGKSFGEPFVFIEPNVPSHKTVAKNKQWAVKRFQKLAERLIREGHRVVQPSYEGARHLLAKVEKIPTRSFRDALVLLSAAKLFIGHEGGLHHGAAALNVPGVVLFGGFIPPEVTGYSMHANLAAPGPACGSLKGCAHCLAAMDSISIASVYEHTQRLLSNPGT